VIDGLPEGWALATLGDTSSKPQYGWTTSAKADSSGLKLLRTTDISSGAIDWSTVPVCEEEPRELNRYLLKPGDIVISRAGSVGISYVLRDTPRAVFASYLIRFRPLGEISSDFIGLFLQTPRYWADITEDSAGIAVPNINASKLASLKFPLPPLAEQRRIIDKVTALLASVNGIRERLVRIPVILKHLRQSVLAAACSGRLTVDTGADEGIEGQRPGAAWRVARLEELSERITKGTTPTSHGHQYQRAGIRFVKVESLSNGRVDHARIRDYISEEAHKSQERSILQEGDILFSIAGTIGETAVVHAIDLPANTNQAVAIIRGTERYLAPSFLRLVLASSIGQVEARKRARGGGMNNISLADLRAIEVPVPPRDEQIEIVHRVDAAFEIADAIERSVAAAGARATTLRLSILTKAFTGALVPTEAELAHQESRDYEPAATLLERIRRGRGASTGTRKNKRDSSRLPAGRRRR
jgi:type I restriction enzyme S subunit